MPKDLIPEMLPVEIVPNNGFLGQWCCTCGLRHLWHFRVERGETEEEDQIIISSTRDDVPSTLRRRLARLGAKKKKAK